MKSRVFVFLSLVAANAFSGMAIAQEQTSACDFRSSAPGREQCTIAGFPLSISDTHYKLENQKLIFLSGSIPKSSFPLFSYQLGKASFIEKKPHYDGSEARPIIKMQWATEDGIITVEEPSINHWLPAFVPDKYKSVIISWEAHSNTLE